MVSSGAALLSGMYTFLLLTKRFNWKHLLEQLLSQNFASTDSFKIHMNIKKALWI